MDLNELRTVLFNRLKALGDPTLSKDALKDELARAQAVTNVADAIIAAGRLELDCMKLIGAPAPLTGLFPKDVGAEARHGAMLAFEARRSWVTDNPEKVKELNAAKAQG